MKKKMIAPVLFVVFVTCALFAWVPQLIVDDPLVRMPVTPSTTTRSNRVSTGKAL
jgi:hypothetical protein